MTEFYKYYNRLNVDPSFRPIKQKRRGIAQNDKKRSAKRSENSSKPDQFKKYSIMTGWPTLS